MSRALGSRCRVLLWTPALFRFGVVGLAAGTQSGWRWGLWPPPCRLALDVSIGPLWVEVLRVPR